MQPDPLAPPYRQTRRPRQRKFSGAAGTLPPGVYPLPTFARPWVIDMGQDQQHYITAVLGGEIEPADTFSAPAPIWYAQFYDGDTPGYTLTLSTVTPATTNATGVQLYHQALFTGPPVNPKVLVWQRSDNTTDTYTIALLLDRVPVARYEG